MTKVKLVNDIYQGVMGITKRQAEEAVDTLFESIITALSNGEKVFLKGIGTLTTVNVPERTYRNPQNPSETVIVSAHKKVKFSMASSLKEKINS